MNNLKKRFLNFFKPILPVLTLILIVCFFFWKFFVKDLIPLPADIVVGVYYPWLDYKWGYETGVPVKNPITTDAISFTYPMQTLAIDLIKEGKFPLWNNLILTGTPLLANFQSSPYSPVNLIYFLTDKVTAWSIQIILQHVLVATFTYLLLRWWKLSSWSAILGSIVFSFSGYNMIWSQWNGHTLSSAFFPLVLLLVDKFVVTRKYIFGILTSVSFGTFFLVGYPQAAIYLALSVFILWLFRIYGQKDWFKITFFLGIFFMIGFLLSLFQFLPGLELLKLSQRSIEPHPFEWAFLPWKKVITFIAPDFFGNHATKNYWGPQDYTSNTGAVGVVAIILSLFSLKLFKKIKEIKISVFLLIFSLTLAFPTPISVFLWESGVLGLNAASAHRSLVLFNLSVSILAAFGFEYINKIKDFKSRILSLIPTFFLIVGFGIWALNIDQQVGVRNLAIPLFVLLSSFVIFVLILRFTFLKYLLILLSIFELFYFGWKFTPFSPRNIIYPTTPVLDFLTNQEKPFRTTGSRVIPINMRMPYGIETVEGYDAVYPVRIARFLAVINSGKVGSPPLGRYGIVDDDTSRILDLINTKYYLALVDKSGKVPERFNNTKRFKTVFTDKTTVVLESKTVLPRSFYVKQWEIVKDENAVLEKLFNKDFEFDRKVILEEDISNNAKIVRFTSDSWYPGWKAYVNGVETKIYRANYAFRAVVVSSENDEVVYKYEPESFHNGVKISLVSLVLLVLLYFRLRNEKF